MTFDTYIFDLDGTLLNTLGDLTASCNYALRANGMEERTLAEVNRFVGNGVRKLIELAVPDGEKNPLFEQTYKTFRDYYMEHSLDTTEPYPGIEEMLARVQADGCRIAVVSNKFYDATQELVDYFFGDYVDVAVGECEASMPSVVPEGFPTSGLRRKPAPDLVHEALRQLGASKRHAVYVGDSDVDLQTAQNSGLPCISVLWGFRDRDFLLAHGARTLIGSPDELF